MEEGEPVVEPEPEPEAEDVDVDIGIDDVKGPLREWVCIDANRRIVATKFRKFLQQFVSEKGESVYEDSIRKMCAENRQSLVVDFRHLSKGAQVLAFWVADAPNEMLRIMDEVAMRVVLLSFPHYREIAPEIHVRISDLPISDRLRDIRQIHLNALIRVGGVVTRRTGVFPQLKMAKYDCVKCGYVIGPIVQTGVQEIRPMHCPNCESKGPFQLNMEQVCTACGALWALHAGSGR